jgi:outer membrane biosynthesis protein TonB
MNNPTDREIRERELRREAEISRDNANTSNVLLVGVFVAMLVALGAAFFVATQNQTEAPEVQPPDVNVEVPQQQAPQVEPPDINVQPPDVDPPDVNIDVPKPETPVLPRGDSAKPAPAPSEAPQQ